MPTLTIRNLSPETHRRLRIRAAEHGRSLQDEVKTVLETLVQPLPDQGTAWIDMVTAKMQSLGETEFELPQRGPWRALPDLEDGGPTSGNTT